MAVNNAFVPDNNDVRPTASAPRKNETNNGDAPNENTTFNLHLDTYFSDEKIHIPEQVSVQKKINQFQLIVIKNK